MTSYLETSLVCLFNRDRKQLLIERNIRGPVGACSFVRPCQRHLDQVHTCFNLGLNRISKLSGVTKMPGERNVCTSMRDLGSCGTNVRRANLACTLLLRKPDTNPLRCADITRRSNAASQTRLCKFDCAHRDFGKRICKSRDPLRPTWTAVVNVTVNEPRDQRPCPTINDSNGRPATLPFGSRPDPVDSTVADFY